jgi:hypothetical protein
MREKIFCRPQGLPLDRNGKVRVLHAAKAYNTKHRIKGRHHIGPLTRCTLQVLETLLWKFHNSRKGDCYPSLESIAAKAGCCKDTVRVAIKALEDAGIIMWVNCFVKQRVPDFILGWRWKVFRTSNAYSFFDPLPCADNHKAENLLETPLKILEESLPVKIVVLNPIDPLDAALIGLGRSMGALP